jgi:hypothetical protein
MGLGIKVHPGLFNQDGEANRSGMTSMNRTFLARHGATLILPALRRLRQEEHMLKASVGYMVSSRPA